MAKSKVETFIGFAIKAKKIALGAGAVEVQKRGTVFLLIVSGDASENTKKLAVKFKNRYNCPLILCKAEFERIVNKDGCKMAAVKDRHLATAITENLDDNYEYFGGDI